MSVLKFEYRDKVGYVDLGEHPLPDELDVLFADAPAGINWESMYIAKIEEARMEDYGETEQEACEAINTETAEEICSLLNFVMGAIGAEVSESSTFTILSDEEYVKEVCPSAEMDDDNDDPEAERYMVWVNIAGEHWQPMGDGQTHEQAWTDTKNNIMKGTFFHETEPPYGVVS